MRIPGFIKKGDTIGFAAPSFGCTTEPYKTCFEKAEQEFTDAGFNISEGPNVRRDDGIGISSAPENCGREFTEMYLSDKNDMIMSCGGGELMCEILEYVDFDALKKAVPKWFCGYSDNTNLVLPLAVICDTASVYGPCAPAFGGIWDHSEDAPDPRNDLMKLLTGNISKVSNYDKWEKESRKTAENPIVPYDLTEDTVIRGFVPSDGPHSSPGTNEISSSPETRDSGKGLQSSDWINIPNIKDYERKKHINFSGRLIGGCLDCLQTLCGTKFDRVSEFDEKYSEDGIIWFIESCDLNPVGIRRALWQLSSSGWFANVKGFIIGRPLHYDEEAFGITRFEAFLEPLRKFNVPVIMDTDIGHLPPQMPVISGAYADVEYSAAGDLTVFYDKTENISGRQLVISYDLSK